MGTDKVSLKLSFHGTNANDFSKAGVDWAPSWPGNRVAKGL